MLELLLTIVKGFVKGGDGSFTLSHDTSEPGNNAETFRTS